MKTYTLEIYKQDKNNKYTLVETMQKSELEALKQYFNVMHKLVSFARLKNVQVMCDYVLKFDIIFKRSVSNGSQNWIYKYSINESVN